MGLVIGFPEQSRAPRVVSARSDSATVIILPVIRIERYTDEPGGSTASRSLRRRRRRRSARSKATA